MTELDARRKDRSGAFAAEREKRLTDLSRDMLQRDLTACELSALATWLIFANSPASSRALQL